MRRIAEDMAAAFTLHKDWEWSLNSEDPGGICDMFRPTLGDIYSERVLAVLSPPMVLFMSSLSHCRPEGPLCSVVGPSGFPSPDFARRP